MPRQKTVRAARRGKKGAGEGGGKKNNLPASEEPSEGPTPTLILRLKVPREVLQAAEDAAQIAAQTAAPTPDIDHGENDEDVGEQLPVVTTRSGRIVKKKKKDDDFLYSDDYKSQLNSSPPKRASEDEGESTYQYRGRTPTPAILNFLPQPQPTAPSRRFNKRANTKNTAFQPSLSSVPEVPVYNIPLDIQTRATSIISMLTQSPKIHIDLPILEYADDTEQPYSADLLMAIYLTAYSSGLWDICDLVSDTWIRAFHTLRRHEEKSGKGRHRMTWRYNDPMTRKREKGTKGFDENPSDYSNVLRVQDPLLEMSVTSNANANLLNLLFAATHKDAGARALWADALALSGPKFEARFLAAGKKGEKWHDDLKDEVMCSALRLAGRKLTLKIEEATEGCWCNGYHEHGRHGEGKCYRARAYERKVGGLDDEEVVSEEDGEGMEGVIMGMFGGAGAGEATGNRVRFEAVPEVEVFDVDAEGETDDG